MKVIKNIESSPRRIGYLDMAKAFAIFLVLIGHETNSIILEQYIFSFHLPLFFWISGFLFTPEKYQHFRAFLYRRLQTLIVPYFIFILISFIFWFTVVRSLSIRGQAFSLNPWFPFWGIFYGLGVEPWRNPLDIALWFLPCLFVTEMIFWHINKYTRGISLVLALIICGVMGYVTSIWVPFRLPWSADVALSAVVFYALGYNFKKLGDPTNNLRRIWKIIIMAALAVLGFWLSLVNGKADMNYNFFGNPFLFYGAAFAGIYFWYSMIRILPTVGAISYIGQNTIVLVGLVGITAFVLQGFMYLLFGSLPTIGKAGLLETIIYTVLEIILLMPVMYVINRFAPFILGRGK
jgi:acyltransferase